MGSLRDKLKKENRLEKLQQGDYSTEINNTGYEEKIKNTQSLVKRVQMRANILMNQNLSMSDQMQNRANQLGKTLKTNTKSTNNSGFKMYQEDKNVKKASTNFGYIAKKGFSGLLSGATGLLQARNTELAKNLKEGKEGKSNETIINSLNPANALISASMKNTKENIGIIKDKDKNLLEKGVGIATNTVSNALNAVSPIRQVLNPVEHLMGKMLPDNSSENVLKLNDKISEPSEKLNQKLADEKGLHSKKVQFIGDAGQSVGNMAPSILASAITKNPAIGLAVMGESVKGQTTQEALKRGADLEKAVKIGDTKGMIEVGTEMLTGGVNVFGKGAVDEIIEKGIDKKVKNEVLNYIAKKGLDLPEEVVEELISDVLGTAIDKGTIDPNASYSLNDFKDTAITTILSTLAINALTGGYGKNAYNQNKAEIQKNIQNSSLSDESKASLARVAEKNNMSADDVQNLINNPPNEQVLQNNQQIIQEQSKTAQNGNMGQTEQSIQNYLKNASENRLDVQNKTVKSIYEVTQRRGIVAEYNADVFKDKNGKVDKNKNAVWTTDENGNRKIIINPEADTETTLQNIMVHELTHDFEGSKEYDALSKLALDKMKTQEGYLEARKDFERIYSQVYDKNSKEFQTLVDQEAVANFLGENLGNQEFINELVNSQPRTTIQKIYDWIVDKIAKVTGNEKLYWKNVEQKFKNAYNSQNVNSNQDSKYSVETLSDGTIYIRDEQNKFTKSDGTKMTPREVYNSLVGKEIDLGDGDKVFILKRLPGNKDLYKELFTRYPKIFNNINDVKKLNTDVNYNIEELLQNSKNILPNEPDKLNRHQKQGIITFDTRIVNFYDGNNAYNIEFSIAKLQDGRKVAYAKRQFDYDDNLTQKIKADETRSSNSPLNQQPLLNNSIPSSNENVNTTTKYSMQETENNTQKDNTGRTLSKEQQEYFKDSKVRDESGNLLTVYHGTPYEFYQFNYDKLGENTSSLGAGFYFTDKANTAEEYKRDGGNVKNVYLDMKKPMKYGKTTISKSEYKKFIEAINKETSGNYLLDYDGIENALMEYDYGGDDIDLVSAVQNASGLTHEKTFEILRNTIGYDGIISEKGFINPDETIYVVFSPNQIKNVDNLNPTDNPDIRYSYQSNGAWNDFLKKHSINKGTGETMQQVKLPQMPIEHFQKVLDTAQHIPQEEKEYLLKSVEDIKRNKTSLEDFKNTVQIMEKAYDEQNENILDTKKTYNTGRREIYQKYMKAKGEYDTSSLDNAKEIIPANKQGRRTKSQWLNIAKQIGTEIADKSNSEIEEIAYRTWQDERPSNKESLNRQGEKFVTFTSDEWINTIYDTVKEQREKYSIDTDNNKGINYFDEDLQAIREASKKGLGDTMTVDEQIEAIQNLDSKELDNTLPDTSSKIVNKLSKEKTPFKKRVAEVRRLITNKGAFVDDLFKATGNKQGIWKYDRYLGSFSEGQVSIGVNQINSNGEIVGDSLLDIYENAKKSGITQKILDDYVLNKDNISRSKYEKYIFGEEISAKDSQRIIDEYDKKYPQLKEYAKQVSDYADNNTKGYLVGTFISQDLHNKLRQMYPDHVPVVRDISETPGLAEYDNVGAQVLKRATGGNQEILSPKEALAQQSVTYARAFRRNEALKEVYKSIKSDTKVLYDLGEIIDIEQANDCIKNAISYDDTLNKYTATVFENGEAKVFEISKGIFDAFNNDTIFDKIDRGLENSLPGKVLKKSTETFKGLTTGKNILYALKNMARDINDAPINSTTNFANYMKDWAYAYEQIVTNGKYYKEYVNAGGSANTFYDYSKGLIKKDFSSLPKKAINFINNQTIGKVEQINEVVETAPRLAEYIATRQRGGSIDEALYNSAEVTTNFKRGGELSKLVDKYGVPYLNASIQGLSKVYRNVSEAKGFKQYAKLAVNATLAGVLPSVINHLVYNDDDDYEELPDYIKDGYYLIKVTDLPNGLQNKLKKWTENNFVRIPKGRISAVLGGTAVRLHENLNNEGEDVWNGYMSDVVLNNIGINNPYTNNLFTPLLKQAMNNEAWYGGSIYSESKYKNKLPVEITDEKTTQLSNWIAETVYNMVGKEKYKQLVDKENGNAFFKVLATPKLLDYAMDQYSGIVGDIVMPMLTPYAENNALVDQFTTSSTLKSSTVSKFYEILGNCYQNSEYATDTDKLTYKYLEEVSKEVGGMYAEKSSIQSDSTLTNKQKQQKTYEIQKEINQKMEEAINSVENMKLTSNTANFNGTEYYKDEEGKWKEVTEKNKIEGLSTETYADYKSKLNKATELKRETEGKENAQLNDAEKIELINNSTYTDKEKDIIYSNNINKDDKTYNSLKLINNNDLDKVEEYLKYHQKQLNGDFNNDKEDDGTKNGKSIRNSGKAKMVNYLNESNFDELESLYLYGRTFKLNSSERTRFARLLNEKELTEEEIKQIYLTLNGVVEMNDGSIKWK